MCPCIPDQTGIWQCWFFCRGENRRTRRKTTRSKDITNNKLNPHMTPGPRIEPGPNWWEASVFTAAPPMYHPCATPVPSLRHPRTIPAPPPYHHCATPVPTLRHRCSSEHLNLFCDLLFLRQKLNSAFHPGVSDFFFKYLQISLSPIMTFHKRKQEEKRKSLSNFQVKSSKPKQVLI